MESLDGKESRSSATVAASTRSKRVPRRQQTGQVSTDEREIQTPSEIIRRYKSILKTLPKAKTMTRAFQKHAIDRNTVVSTSVIGELAIAAPEVYEDLLAKKPCGETVLAFAKRCEAAIQGDEDVKEKMESMKARGTLLPIRRSKPV
ncbi:hypothetical protein SRHO_G00179590 [Serrasalmus rhombeus]